MALEQWDIDTVHSSITFAVRHLVVSKARGRFGKWTGSLHIDEGHPEASRIEARIDAASIDTNEPQRDQHLRSADFFDVDQFPDIRFVSSRIERIDDDRFRIVGDLTMHGVTREVVFEAEQTGRVKDPWGNDRRGFTVSAAINRKDFGITFNQVLDSGGLALGDKVEVAVELEVLKPVAATA